MADKPSDMNAARLALATQGQSFTSLSSPSFTLAGAQLRQPMELTPAQLRGIRMVDETIVIVDRGLPSRPESNEKDRAS